MIEKDIIIIGGGQAGLSMGYFLHKNRCDFVILDAGERPGDSWRNRYDSLVLFTPRKYSNLPGFAFPGNPNEFPTKDEAAEYLEQYAQRYSLPILFNTRVSLLKKLENRFYIRSDRGDEYIAKQVVAATGPFQKAYIPAYAKELNREIYQTHSSAYRSPAELRPGPVLVVGGGNSGAQIAVELSKQFAVTISVSRKMNFKPLHLFGKSIFWYFDKLGLLEADVHSLRGSWLKKQPEQVYGYELKGLLESQIVKMKPRTIMAERDTVYFADGSSVRINNVIWATGFRPDYSWIDIEGLLDSNGYPHHEKGVSRIEGLYFLGMPWQSCRGSALLGWVGRDAEYVANHILR